MRISRIVALALVFAASELSGQAQPARWTLVPDLRIGSIDQPNYALSQISDVAVDGDGSVYVGQPTARHVKVFDSQGRYVRTIGRQGGGPGEFETIGRVGLRGDTLWASDIQLSRLTFFTRGGALLNALTISGPMIPGISSRPTPPSILATNGTILAHPLTGTLEDVEWISIVRMDDRGELIETFGAVRSDPPIRIPGTIDGRPFAMMVAKPVSASGLWAVSPVDGSLVIVDRPIATSPEDTQFRVQRLRSASDTIFDRYIRYTPRRIPRATIDSVVGRDFGAAGNPPIPSEMIQQYRAQVGSIEFDAPVSRLVVGRDGTIWLRREDTGLHQAEWIVLDESGELMASFQTPTAVRIVQAERDRVWTVETDDFDVPYLVRYRVQRP